MGRAAKRRKIERRRARGEQRRRDRLRSQHFHGIYQFESGDLAVLKAPFSGICMIEAILEDEPSYKIYKVRQGDCELVVGDRSVRPCYPTFKCLEERRRQRERERNQIWILCNRKAV